MDHKWLVFAVVGCLAALFFLRKKGVGASAYLASSPQAADVSAQSAERVSMAQLASDAFKNVLSFEATRESAASTNVLEEERITSAERLGTLGFQNALQAELARADADKATANSQAQLSIFNAQTSAQLEADRIASQNAAQNSAAQLEQARINAQLTAQNNVLKAQRNSSIFNAISSSLNNVLPFIFNRSGSQSSSSGGLFGGSSGGWIFH